MSAPLFNLSLSREISSSLLLTSEKGLRDRGSLVVKQSEHKGRAVLVWFRTCKGFFTRYWNSQVCCLGTGRRHKGVAESI